MTFDSFSKMLVSIYAVLLAAMKRIAIYHELFVTIMVDADQQVSLGNPLEGLGIRNADGPLVREVTLEQAIPNSATSPVPNSMQTYAATLPLGSTTAPYYSLVTESAEIVFAIADLAHVRCAKLVGVRADQNAQLNPTDFYRLFGVTWKFVVEGEGLCGRTCYGLRGTITSQAKSFLSHFHMEKMKQQALLVENEQWVQAEVPIDFQRIVDRILAWATAAEGIDFDDGVAVPEAAAAPSFVSGAEMIQEDASKVPPGSPPGRVGSGDAAIMGGVSDGRLEERPGSPATPTVGAIVGTGTMGVGPAGAEAASDSNRFLVVKGQNFFAVICSLMLIKMLEEYLRCMANIPSLTTDVMQRMMELLKVCSVALKEGFVPLVKQ